MTEEEVKLRLITPAIISKWDKDTQVRMEYSFTAGQVIVRGSATSRGKRKKADYVLCYKPNIPLAIVEAKDDAHAAGAGLQQGLEYAEALDIPFVYASNGAKFIQHDRFTGLEREVPIADFPTPDELWNRFKIGKGYTAAEERVVAEPYYYEYGGKKPRYYQTVAINRAVEAIAKGQNRILLVMATGTGKTYTAFQIIHRYRKANSNKKILYLADRNILIDQTIQKDFKPFQKIMAKVQNKNLNSAFEIYMALYQQLAGEKGREPFRQFKPEFFDLIIVDECHRGSAKEDSEWRSILDYFSSATHIGMTATPKETKEISNITYFGEPVYTYSLKQGIEDGFLAPYKVIRVGLNVDLEGWRPYSGQTDKDGFPIEDREYNVKDYDKNIVIDERTQEIARRITKFLIDSGDRFSKTIVFCVDIEHAERMRRALVNENVDIVKKNQKYIMRITGDNAEGKKQLDYFVDPNSDPKRNTTIVTTSKLMTTGVDCETCKLIVLESNINSMTEFKQIIGRGTRLYPEPPHKKEYFTIMDFRGVTRLFADPDFDGTPVSIIEIPPQSDDGSGGEPTLPTIIDTPIFPLESLPPQPKLEVDGVAVDILSERVQYLDINGKLITESLTEYTKKGILGMYNSLDEFIKAWTQSEKKAAIIQELKDKGILLDALKQVAGNKDFDEFDLICHIAFDKKPLTKAERAAGVKKRDYLNKYEGLAREVLAVLIDKYATNGIADLETITTLSIDPFKDIASPQRIIKAFGGKEQYMQAVRLLEQQIYEVAAAA
jgi:type I restriction enzyme R subunit